MKVVGVQLEVKKRGLPFLILGCRGQDIIRLRGGLGHCDIDDHCQIKAAQRLPEMVTASQGMNRIGRLDQHGPKPVGMIVEDFFSNHIAGHQTADNRSVGHWRGTADPSTARHIL